jgi:XH domain
LGPRTAIVLKGMGELNTTVFKKSAPPGQNAETWAATSCAKWQDVLKNPEWRPFKKDGPRGDEKAIRTLILLV